MGGVQASKVFEMVSEGHGVQEGVRISEVSEKVSKCLRCPWWFELLRRVSETGKEEVKGRIGQSK
jgi:hypothetical protein